MIQDEAISISSYTKRHKRNVSSDIITNDVHVCTFPIRVHLDNNRNKSGNIAFIVGLSSATSQTADGLLENQLHLKWRLDGYDDTTSTIGTRHFFKKIQKMITLTSKNDAIVFTDTLGICVSLYSFCKHAQFSIKHAEIGACHTILVPVAFQAILVPTNTKGESISTTESPLQLLQDDTEMDVQMEGCDYIPTYYINDDDNDEDNEINDYNSIGKDSSDTDATARMDIDDNSSNDSDESYIYDITEEELQKTIISIQLPPVLCAADQKYHTSSINQLVFTSHNVYTCGLCLNTSKNGICYPNGNLVPLYLIEDFNSLVSTIPTDTMVNILNSIKGCSSSIMGVTTERSHIICLHCLHRLFLSPPDCTLQLQRYLSQNCDFITCPLCYPSRTCYDGKISIGFLRWLAQNNNMLPLFEDSLRIALSLTHTTTNIPAYRQPQNNPWFPAPRAYTDRFLHIQPTLTFMDTDIYGYLLNYLVDICKMSLETVSVTCPICLISLYKTTACNSMAHCGVEICNVCGLFTTAIGKHLPEHHWDATGSKGCPRWDQDIFWKRSCHIQYKCEENKCHTHDMDCKLLDHIPGRIDMNAVRLFNMLFHRFVCKDTIGGSFTRRQTLPVVAAPSFWALTG